jgi:hypothetical protein
LDGSRDRPKLPGHPCAMIWHAQSCCGRLGGTAKGNVKPTDAGKSLATTQLEHVEVCHGGVFACSKSVHNESVETQRLQRAVSCRERGKFSADVDAVCLEGVLPSCERSQLVRDAQPMHGWYLRCAHSFSCIQRSRCERDEPFVVGLGES